MKITFVFTISLVTKSTIIIAVLCLEAGVDSCNLIDV